MEKSSDNIDALIEPLLLAASDEQADLLLSHLITTRIGPVIERVISYKLHFGPQDAAGQADDLHQEALAELLAQLRKLRRQPQAHPISDVCGLAAVIAHRVCARWMRCQFPHRHALKNRLHYLLTRQRGFALWEDENHTKLAGFTAWQGQPRTAGEERLRRLSDEERLLPHIRSLIAGERAAKPAVVLAMIFNHLGGPVEFDRLVGALASLAPFGDYPVGSLDQDGGPVRLAAGGPDPAWEVEKRIFLQRLWEEVGGLPRSQRAALLLNLRDAEGRGCIALFPATGIATLRQLAEAVEMSPEAFAGLWNDLPLEDVRIAELLQLTRQQVINARKSARERLTRRLKGFI